MFAKLTQALLVFGAFGLISACSSNPITGSSDLQEAKEACPVSTEINKFIQDGHLLTTFSILQDQGLPNDRAAMIAFYSQYPDIDHDYEAVPVAFKYALAFWNWEWRSEIMGGLHSLHGGDSKNIAERRENIKNSLKQTLRDEQLDWLSGLLIHAYGDAYAHVTKSIFNGKEVAYGGFVGHLWPSLFSIVGVGTSPDDISGSKYNTFRYAQYVNDFNGIFNSEQAEDPTQVMQDVISNTCKDEKCFSYHTELNKNELVEGFTSCMIPKVRQLTKEEVLKAVSLIENGPSS